MLYILTAAGKPWYLTNLLNTLHLPKGSYNELEYSPRGKNYHIDKRASNAEPGEKVIIVFVDLSSTSNGYYPIRLGTLISIVKGHEKTRFKVELGDFCSASVKDEFYTHINEVQGGIVFRKRENGDENGAIALLESGNKVLDLLDIGGDEWLSTVREIADCKKIKEQAVIFTKIEIMDSNNKSLPIGRSKEERFFALRANTSYELEVSYFLPELYRDINFCVNPIIKATTEVFSNIQQPKQWANESSYEKVKVKTKNEKSTWLTEINIIVEQRCPNIKSAMWANKGFFVKVIGTGRKFWEKFLFIAFLIIEKLISNISLESAVIKPSRINGGLDFIEAFCYYFTVIGKFIRRTSLLNTTMLIIVPLITVLLVKTLGEERNA